MIDGERGILMETCGTGASHETGLGGAEQLEEDYLRAVTARK